MVRRKQSSNAVDYFDKTFAEYKEGFSGNGEIQKRKKTNLKHFFSGESWLGLENLHRLTSQQSYSLQITMTDWDQQKYVAVYHQFEVRQIKSRHATNSWRLFTAARVMPPDDPIK